MTILVENMTGRTGRAVANQFTIDTRKGQYFQSYDSIIAFKPNIGIGEEQHKKTRIDVNTWDYSRTTMRYLCQFLETDAKTLRKDIAGGKYKLTDLN